MRTETHFVLMTEWGARYSMYYLANSISDWVFLSGVSYESCTNVFSIGIL